MSEQQTRAGARVTRSEIFVNTDRTTMFGNGTIDHPLYTEPGSAPTAEHIDVDTEGAASPTVNTTFVTDIAGAEVTNVTLADGETDGFQKTIVLGTSETQWEITPANFGDGSSISFTGSGSAKFVWDADGAVWSLLSMLGGTIN